MQSRVLIAFIDSWIMRVGKSTKVPSHRFAALFFCVIDMFSVIKYHFFSRHRELYRAIAREYGTTAVHVYRLAHGRRGRNNSDYYIIKKLREQGVITATFYE